MKFSPNFRFLMLTVSVPASALMSQTDASLSFRESPDQQLTFVEAQNGDLYMELSHHGPAIENKWVAYRMYFKDSLGIDILSKFHERLELEESQWYGNEELHSNGYGEDNYMIGNSVGLGGVRLWDGEKAIMLKTETKRFAQVIQTEEYSKLRMTTLAAPYGSLHADLEIEITVFNEHRHAQVDVFVLTPEPVSLATGIVKHERLTIDKGSNYILTWGDYGSPAAQSDYNVGAALIYNPGNIDRIVEEPSQFLIISKPTRHLKYFISSSNEKEEGPLNTFEGFRSYVESGF